MQASSQPEFKALGAGTFFRPGPVTDASIQPSIDNVLRDGYVILPNVFSAAEVAEARKELARLEAAQAGPASQGGRNAFEGLKTNRVYALVDKSRVLDKFALNPTVLALNDYFLEHGYLLSAFHTINVTSGSDPQPLHTDDGFVGQPRPAPLFGASIMIALDDYTVENGSTVVIPGSHLWDNSRIPARSQAVSVTMPAGSVVYFLWSLYHGAGANTATTSRRAMTVQYCQPWIRQIENMMVAVGWEDLDSVPKQLRDMMGFKTHPPFIGYVDGVSPRKGIEMRKQRLVEDAIRKLAASKL